MQRTAGALYPTERRKTEPRFICYSLTSSPDLIVRKPDRYEVLICCKQWARSLTLRFHFCTLCIKKCFRERNAHEKLARQSSEHLDAHSPEDISVFSDLTRSYLKNQIWRYLFSRTDRQKESLVVQHNSFQHWWLLLSMCWKTASKREQLHLFSDSNRDAWRSKK